MNQNTSKKSRTVQKDQEKTQPYIFVSYSHEDKAEVREIIERLMKDGYSLWYDKYDKMNSDEHWLEWVESKLVDCQVFLLFMTNNYKASTPCKKEFILAQSLGKPLVPVFLENVQCESGSGYQLGLADSMRIMAYEFNWKDDFYRELISRVHIQRCKIKEKPATNSEKAERNKAVSALTLTELVQKKKLLMDYSALISPGGEAFFKKIIPLLEEHGKKLNVQQYAFELLNVRRKLQSPNASVCEKAYRRLEELEQRGLLQLIERSRKYRGLKEENATGELEEIVKYYRESEYMLVITQNDSLAKRLMELNHSRDRNDRWITLKRIGESGDLEDPHFIKNSAKSRN